MIGENLDSHESLELFRVATVLEIKDKSKKVKMGKKSGKGQGI